MKEPLSFQKFKSICFNQAVLYRIWNEHHLSAYFRMLIIQLLSYWFLFQAVFLCDTDFVIKIY